MKVLAMEDQWRQTHDWVNNTGQCVLRDDSKEAFDNVVANHCSFYYNLEPIMIDGAGTNPPVTSKNLDDSDENDDDKDVGLKSSFVPKTITPSANDDKAKKMTVPEKKAVDKKKR